MQDAIDIGSMRRHETSGRGAIPIIKRYLGPIEIMMRKRRPSVGWSDTKSALVGTQRHQHRRSSPDRPFAAAAVAPWVMRAPSFRHELCSSILRRGRDSASLQQLL